MLAVFWTNKLFSWTIQGSRRYTWSCPNVINTDPWNNKCVKGYVCPFTSIHEVNATGLNTGLVNLEFIRFEKTAALSYVTSSLWHSGWRRSSGVPKKRTNSTKTENSLRFSYLLHRLLIEIQPVFNLSGKRIWKLYIKFAKWKKKTRVLHSAHTIWSWCVF